MLKFSQAFKKNLNLNKRSVNFVISISNSANIIQASETVSVSSVNCVLPNEFCLKYLQTSDVE